MRKWCMCTKLQAVARDMYSTCSLCGGQDAYGLSEDRPERFKKVVGQPPNTQIQIDKKTCSYNHNGLKEQGDNFCKNCGQSFYD